MALFNRSTTRASGLKKLRAMYAQSVPFGGNQAIKAHAEKVERMTEAEWIEHRDRLNARANQPGMKAAINRMADELFTKINGSK